MKVVSSINPVQRLQQTVVRAHIQPISLLPIQVSESMRALVCTQLASPLEAIRAPSESGKGPLELHNNYPAPALQPSFVRIKVLAASINFADALQLQGLYQEKPQLPYVPGGEVRILLRVYFHALECRSAPFDFECT